MAPAPRMTLSAIASSSPVATPGRTAAATVSSVSATMRLAPRIFSISARDLTTITGFALDSGAARGADQRRRDLALGAVSVNLGQPVLLLVVRHERPGALEV